MILRYSKFNLLDQKLLCNCVKSKEQWSNGTIQVSFIALLEGITKSTEIYNPQQIKVLLMISMYLFQRK